MHCCDELLESQREHNRDITTYKGSSVKDVHTRGERVCQKWTPEDGGGVMVGVEGKCGRPQN